MITTYIGPMFSGKSQKLLDIYDGIYNKNNIYCFKPIIDTRDNAFIKSRVNNNKLFSFLIDEFEDIPNILENNKDLNCDGKIILIDEAQFLKGNVKVLLNLSIIKNYDIFIAGLNLTSELKPFKSMSELLAISDQIEKLYSTCHFCGKRAKYTYCNVSKESDILVGSDQYIAICDKCIKYKTNLLN